MDGERGRQALGVELAAQATGPQLVQKQHQDAPGLRVSGVSNLHTVGVDAGPLGYAPHEVFRQQDVDVLGDRTLKSPLQRLATLEDLDEAGDERPLVRAPAEPGHHPARPADAQVDGIPPEKRDPHLAGQVPGVRDLHALEDPEPAGG